ncbi:NUDIX domain-containing protein [Nonomuraea sp. CA-141351]|uniref:NUDIX domain-containing protein n=1 Tax=Nonomuraea sp. CA-141351 TaxID=3239996 RepID=UPI003D914088
MVEAGNDQETVPFAQARAAAGALLFNDSGHVLLVRPTYKSYMDIPGGYVEPVETPYEACVREVREELDGLLIERLARRLKAAATARELGETVCLEHGRAAPTE